MNSTRTTDPFADAPEVKDNAMSYEAYRDWVKEAQSGKKYEVVKEEMQRQSRFSVELDNLPTQDHIWVDRGAVISCEGASHANHRSFKRVR